MLPVLSELTEEVTNIAFIQGRAIAQEGRQACTGIDSSQDLLLLVQRNLRIRNQEIRHEGMGPLTLAALDPLNFKRKTFRTVF